jgi:hypothetical protein
MLSFLKCVLVSYLFLFMIHWSNAEIIDPKEHNHYQQIADKMYNMSVQMTKQAKLPCFVELNRRYIWLDANNDRIISIDSSIIINDRRFAIELSSDCFSQFQTTEKADRNQLMNLNGCWIYLIINYVLLNDESLYICQTDTMLSTQIHLNVLTSPYLNRKAYLNQKQDMRYFYKNNLNVVEGQGVELLCEAAGKPKPVTKWFSKSFSKNISTYLKSKNLFFFFSKL